MARVLATTSAAARPQEVADSYAVLALEVLRHARRAGYFEKPDSAEQLRTDAAFESLRGRQDYRKLLQELGH